MLLNPIKSTFFFPKNYISTNIYIFSQREMEYCTRSCKNLNDHVPNIAKSKPSCITKYQRIQIF